MFAKYKIESDSAGMVIKPLPINEALGLVGSLVFFAFFFIGFSEHLLIPNNIGEFVSALNSGPGDERTHALIILFVILSIGVTFVRSLLSILYSKTIFLDHRNRRISERKEIVGRYSEVNCVQLREISDSDSASVYRLSIRWKDQRKKVHVVRTTDRSRAEEIGGDIADLLKVPLNFISN